MSKRRSVFSRIPILLTLLLSFACAMLANFSSPTSAPQIIPSITYSTIASAANNSAPPYSKELTLISTFEGGKLYTAGKFKVLELNGTYRQMGRQYGVLLSAELRGMYNEIIKQYAEHNIVNSQPLHDFSLDLFSLYPYRFQELAKGLSETSTLSMDKIAVLNEFFDYILLYSSNRNTATDNNHCAALTAWGDYTGNSPLVMGRNFDYPSFFRKFNPYITIVVYNPTESANSASVITYPGQIGAIQAFNNKGLVLENNDGSSSGDKNRYFGQRIPFLISDLELMLDNSSLKSLDASLWTRRIHYPLIFNVVDASSANCYEMTTYDMKRREGGTSGLLIGVNHFISPAWPASVRTESGNFDGIENSLQRYNNLKLLAEKYKGTIDAQTMMKIFDIPFEQGGATPQDRSIYQYVALPQLSKLWIKSLEFEDWTEVDLSKLYRPNRP